MITPPPDPDEPRRQIFTLADLFGLIAIFFQLAAYFAVVYCASHFVTKYW